MVVWSTIEASCPVCAHRLRLREVGSGFAAGQDTDLFVRMRGKHVIQAEIHTCHSCRFSGYTTDFLRDLSPASRERFLIEVAAVLTDEATNPNRAKTDDAPAAPREPRTRLRRTPLPHVQYSWAAKTAEVIGLSAHEQGMRLVRAYWCLRIPPSNQLDAARRERTERRCLTAAIRKLRQDLRHRDDPHDLYLVAELCRRNRNFLLAESYFKRFLRQKGARRYVRQAAEKLLLVAREHLAEPLSMEDILYNPAPGQEEES